MFDFIYTPHENVNSNFLPVSYQYDTQIIVLAKFAMEMKLVFAI